MDSTMSKVCGRRAGVVLAPFLLLFVGVAVDTAAASYDPSIDKLRSRIRGLEVEILATGDHLLVNHPCGLRGEVIVQRFNPDDSDGDGLADIQTEMLSMNMSGGGFTLRESPTQPSLGAIEELAQGTGFPANSFFDVFFEIDLPTGDTIFNIHPHRVVSVINRIPPFPHTVYEPDPDVPWWPPAPPVNPLPLPLYIDDGQGGLIHVANLIGNPIHKIVPLPAAFPLGMSALGLLGGYRSWRAWIKRRAAA